MTKEFSISFISRKFLVILSILLFSSLIFLIYLNISQNSKSEESTSLINHTYRVIHGSERLLTLSTQEVMAYRGYVITGESRYLEPLIGVRNEADSIIRVLNRLTGDNPLQQQRIQILDSLLEERTRHTNLIISARNVSMIQAVDLISKGKGKLILDSIRNTINVFKQTELDLLDQRSADYLRARNLFEFSRLLTLAMVAIISGTFIYIFYSFSRAQLQVLKEAKFRSTVLENISEAVVITDKDLHITDWNNGAEFMYGYTRSEVVGKNFTEVVGVNDSEFLKYSLSQLRTYGRWNGEIIHYHKNSYPINVLASVNMLKLRGEAGFEGAVCIMRDITERKRMELSLEESNETLENLLEQQLKETRDTNKKLRQLNNSLQEAREDERKRISRELHDDLGQVLTSSKIHLNFLMDELNITDSQLKQRLLDVIKNIQKAIDSVRNIAMELRPISIEDLGLFQAIQQHALQFGKDMKIQVEVENEVPDLIIDMDKEIHIFRIFQEALNNVAKHAVATNVYVLITIDGDNLVLCIRDNGKGFDTSIRNTNTLGLTTIQERAKILHGTYNIQSMPGKGTEVKVDIPLVED